MAWWIAGAMVASTALSAVMKADAQADEAKAGSESLIAQGKAGLEEAISQEKAMLFEAEQYRRLAGEELGAAQRAAREELRKKRIIQSTLTARAAASGAGATDPTVADLMGDLEEQGRYRALTALYEGGTRASTMVLQADELTRRGRETRRAGEIRMAGARSGSTGILKAGKKRVAGTAISTAGRLASQGMSIYDRYNTGTT